MTDAAISHGYEYPRTVVFNETGEERAVRPIGVRMTSAANLRDPHLRITVYGRSFFGFARWTAVWVEPGQAHPEIELSTPQYAGWVRRSLRNVVVQTYPILPSRRTCKNLARRQAEIGLHLRPSEEEMLRGLD